MLTTVVAAGTLVLGVLVAADLYHWRSSRRGLPPRQPTTPTSEAVVVLGYGNRGSRANAVNRYRVRAGIRSIDPHVSRSTLVLCGGPVHSAVSEARIMARYARDELGYDGELVLEGESLSTEENIRNAIPLIEHADSIAIVSNSPHAEVAREILRDLRPDLAARLRRAHEHRFGEIPMFKPVAVLLALRHRRRHRHRAA